jgi:hypothetical protein
MDLAELSNRVTKDLNNAISAELTVEERAAISKIVQQALLDASRQTYKECREAAVACCGHEADLAHKIQEQMDKKRLVLIANLMGMR